MSLSYNLYCFSSSTTQRFHTLAYIMISSVSFSNRISWALLKHHSFQVTFPSAQTVRCAGHRPVYASRMNPLCCFFCAFIPKECIDTTASKSGRAVREYKEIDERVHWTKNSEWRANLWVFRCHSAWEVVLFFFVFSSMPCMIIWTAMQWNG